jgi:hypothetical protein
MRRRTRTEGKKDRTFWDRGDDPLHLLDRRRERVPEVGTSGDIQEADILRGS